MSYTNQTTSSLPDLISKLNTFLSGTPGWTTNHVPASGVFAARKTGSGFDIGFASQWNVASPNNLGIYQWIGGAYNAGVNPWQQTNDSGNGAASTVDATLGSNRHAPITNTPVQFWCFEDDNYFHCVVQATATIFVHFGAGLLDKTSDWTGGEYVYGYRRDTANGATQVLSAGSATYLLDGLLQNFTPGLTTLAETYAATIHAEGLAGQGGSEKWCVSMGNQPSANLGNDRQGSPQPRRHWLGGYRGGPHAKNLGLFRGSLQRGLCPMYPITSFYWRRSPDELHGPMGQMRDVRGLNIRDFAAGDEITVGSDVWVVFPAGQKSAADIITGTGFTGYQGIAYKKVTT
jgi:hypothetical protein